MKLSGGDLGRASGDGDGECRSRTMLGRKRMMRSGRLC